MLACRVLACVPVGAPARIAHGCGSSKSRPDPICRSPEYPREYQPLPVHSRRSVATSRAPDARSCLANSASPRRSASSASLGYAYAVCAVTSIDSVAWRNCVEKSDQSPVEPMM